MLRDYTRRNLIVAIKMLLFVVAFWVSQTAESQVTIGDGTAPQDYSLLEISAKNGAGGLRLPQLTTAQRESLNISALTGTPKDLAVRFNYLQSNYSLLRVLEL